MLHGERGQARVRHKVARRPAGDQQVARDLRVALRGRRNPDSCWGKSSSDAYNSRLASISISASLPPHWWPAPRPRCPGSASARPSDAERQRIIDLTVGAEVFAPETLPYEIGNALSALVKRRRLTGEQAMAALAVTRRIPVRLVVVDVAQALQLATGSGIYAYDA
jgi:hypothetical protein